MDDHDGITIAPLESRYCAVCGKDMVNKATNSSFVGMHISMRVEPVAEGQLEFCKKQLGVYADLLELDRPFEIAVCWECWVRSLGVKAPNRM